MARREASCFPSPDFQAKSKNPVKLSVVLALGESSSKAIEDGQKPRLLPDKTTQNSAGFKAHLHRLDATLDKPIVTQAWVSRNPQKSLKPRVSTYKKDLRYDLVVVKLTCHHLMTLTETELHDD